MSWTGSRRFTPRRKIERTGWGKIDSVLAYYLVSDAGTDVDMQEALALKVSQFIGIMNDKAETDDERLLGQAAANQHMQRVIEKLTVRGSKGKCAVERNT